MNKPLKQIFTRVTNQEQGACFENNQVFPIMQRVNMYVAIVSQEEMIMNNPYMRMHNLNSNPLVIDALEKVKSLNNMVLGYLTTRQVAEYFEVPRETVKKCITRNFEELSINGMIVLQGEELREFKNKVGDIMSPTSIYTGKDISTSSTQYKVNIYL